MGDVVLPRILPKENFAEVFGIYWIAVLCLTLWILALAWGDITAIRVHSKTVLNRNLKKQRKLEEQLADLKKTTFKRRGFLQLIQQRCVGAPE